MQPGTKVKASRNVGVLPNPQKGAQGMVLEVSDSKMLVRWDESVAGYETHWLPETYLEVMP